MSKTKTIEIEEKFNKVLIKFLLNEPFFSTIIRHMRKEMTYRIPTAGVTFVDDSITLYWNPEFVEKLSIKHLMGLLKHECYHLIFQHLTSRKQDPHLQWNIATDLAINSIIPEDELPDGGLIPGNSLKKGNNYDLLSDKIKDKAKKMSNFIKSLPKNKSAEWYMEKIKENKEISEACNDVFSEKCQQSKDSSGSGAGFDHHFDNDEMSESKKEIVDGKIKKILKEAVDRAERTNSWGSCSSIVKERIRSMLNDTISWQSVLRYFCGTKQRARKSRTFKKINRKYPYIHPGRKIKHTSNLAVYIDQSGSIDDADITLFFGALSKLSKNVTFTVYHFDSEVDEKSKYIWKKNMGFRAPYRTRCGGTCFDSIESHFRKYASEYDGYIAMTDGCASKPKNCISKRCWVLLPGHKLYFDPDKRDTVVTMKQ